MGVHSESFAFRTKGEVQVIDISDRVASAVARAKIHSGIACVFTPSSTAAIVANEDEAGLREDFESLLERLAPRNADYHHHRAGGERNGHSHLRSILLGPSVTFPVADGKPALGTWQQVLFVELDTHSRERTVCVDVVGE